MHRVLAHVEPEHLLLEREPLRLRELDVGDRRCGAPTTASGAGVVDRGEQVELALGLVAPTLEHGRRRSSRSTCSRPWRGWPSESNAPALISDSIGPLVEHRRVDAVAEVVEVGERTALLARRDDLRDHALADVAHRRQAEADRLAVVGRSRTEKSDSDSLTSGTSTVDAELAALVEEDRGLVLVGLDAREQRGEVLDRVVRLQVRGLVRDVAVADRVRLVERVVGERLDRVEDPLAELLGSWPCATQPSTNFERSLRDEVALIFLPVALRRLSASSSV